MLDKGLGYCQHSSDERVRPFLVCKIRPRQRKTRGKNKKKKNEYNQLKGVS